MEGVEKGVAYIVMLAELEEEEEEEEADESLGSPHTSATTS